MRIFTAISNRRNRHHPRGLQVLIEDNSQPTATMLCDSSHIVNGAVRRTGTFFRIVERERYPGEEDTTLSTRLEFRDE